MIEEKLKKARLENTRRRTRMGLYVFIIFCFCGLVVIGLSFHDFSRENKLPTVQAVAPIGEHLSESETQKNRDALTQKLQDYENQLAPRLAGVNVDLWNPDAWSEINAFKKQVMLDFSNGNYLAALENFQSLNELTLKILALADHFFEKNLKKASLFLAEGHHDQAKFHIEKALMVNGQSPEAIRLQVKIDELPRTLPLLKGAAAARSENDLQKEYDFLQQLLSISPKRQGVAARLKELAESIKTQKFDGHISSGFARIEKKQADKARYHYLAARQIDPQRTELAILWAQLSALEASIRVQKAIAQAEQALRRDDWQQVKEHFLKAAKDAPEDKAVVEGLKRADLVLGLQAKFDHYFQHPYRLAHKTVRNDAQQTLATAKTASGYSFAIKSRAAKLSALIDKINQPVPVSIISDNMTFVLVRRVGKVGVVFQKTIQLKPGNYTFEGTRKGFKSKLVDRLISYDRNNISVQVICDEPI